ncbi:Rpn family recombination-promoting nuclease/putative transposase [Skermanella rosea]|uniref:Rpn family recombination-promoting nuclease/putative transposase n=1 Tax=Skermanella rosea TaxID=1817965 RepID=UPI00193479EE|nr:Rpn family recombination-promoting nuclease/putative transposase [Skermanella rosea]UEM01535.1 Rpn family recombination-promoting nuclease/putative transposase [Skermanella rosea]
MHSRLIRRHDHFFKRLLEQPGTAGALLRERLPPEIAKLLGPDEPVLVQGSFVDRELREYRTDRLYRVRLRDGREAYLYVLIEHKAAPDPRVGLQLLGYMTQFWLSWDKGEGKAKDGKLRPLPLLFPLVVYHGAAEWGVPLSFAEAVDLDDETLRPYLLDFRYSLTDLGRIDDAGLSRQKELRIGLLLLKHGGRGGDLRQILVEVGRAAAALSTDDLVTLVRYIVSEPNEVEAAMLRDLLREIVPGQEARIMSIAAEQWKAEGMARGRAEGKAEILLRLLRRRFGEIPQSTFDTVHTASDDELTAWAENILDASSLDAVFHPSRAN